MNEENKHYCERFKREFTEEQRKALILGLVDYVDDDMLTLLADVHWFGVHSLRNGVKGYLEELMEREE